MASYFALWYVACMCDCTQLHMHICTCMHAHTQTHTHTHTVRLFVFHACDCRHTTTKLEERVPQLIHYLTNDIETIWLKFESRLIHIIDRFLSYCRKPQPPPFPSFVWGFRCDTHKLIHKTLLLYCDISCCWCQLNKE